MFRGRFLFLAVFISIVALLTSAQGLSAQAADGSRPAQSDDDAKAQSLETEFVSHFVHGRFGQAATAYQSLKDKHPGSKYAAYARLKYADMDLANGKIDRAISEYEAVLPTVQDADDKAALIGKIGVAYIHAGDLTRATQNLRESLKSSTRWDDRTSAHGWLLRVSMLEAAANAGQLSECGRDSLAIALAMLGKEKASEAVRATRVTRFEGLTAAQLVGLARSNDVDSWALSVPRDGLADLHTPFIAHYGDRHFVVVTAVRNGSVSIVDPFKGDSTVAMDAFGDRVTGNLVTFAPEDVQKGRALTVAEASLVRGGCGQANPGADNDDSDQKEGDDSDPDKECNDDKNETAPNSFSYSPAYDIMPEIPVFAPFDDFSIDGAWKRVLGEAEIVPIRRRIMRFFACDLCCVSHPGRVYAGRAVNKKQTSSWRAVSPSLERDAGGREDRESVSAYDSESEGAHSVTAKRVGLIGSPRTGGLAQKPGFSAEGGIGNIASSRRSHATMKMLPPPRPTPGPSMETFSIPSFNAVNLNVTLRILPVYLDTGTGPDFEPSLTYKSKTTEEDFGPKWLSAYNARFSYLTQTTIKLMTMGGDCVVFEYDSQNQVWVAQNGNKLKLEVDGDNDVVVTNPDTGITCEYDAGELRIKSVRDLWGQALTMYRDANGKITKVSTAEGRDNLYQYDAGGLCTLITTATGDTAKFYYDQTGLLTATTDLGNGTSQYYYDSNDYMTKRVTTLGTEKYAFILPDESSNEYKVTFTSRIDRQMYLHWNASDGVDTLVEKKKGRFNPNSAKIATAGGVCIAWWVNGGSGQTEAAAISKYDRDADGYITRVGKKYGGTWYYTAYLLDAHKNVTKRVLPDSIEVDETGK